MPTICKGCDVTFNRTPVPQLRDEYCERCNEEIGGGDMNRDELLDKLAMELEEWPYKEGMMQVIGDGFLPTAIHGDSSFSRDQYLQRRTELINKPSWDEAPEWAQWLAQDSDGTWTWFEGPAVMAEEDYQWYEEEGVDLRLETAALGRIPAGHDWRETLEKRPQGAEEWPEDRMDTIGSNGPTGDHYDEDSDSESALSKALRGDGEYPKEYWHTTTADNILAAARQHMLDRASTYDKPEGERSMNSTVLAFASITGVLMTEEQGWLFMQILKAVRSQQGDYRADSYEDGAAYAALAGEAAARDRRP